MPKNLPDDRWPKHTFKSSVKFLTVKSFEEASRIVAPSAFDPQFGLGAQPCVTRAFQPIRGAATLELAGILKSRQSLFAICVAVPRSYKTTPLRPLCDSLLKAAGSAQPGFRLEYLLREAADSASPSYGVVRSQKLKCCR